MRQRIKADSEKFANPRTGLHTVFHTVLHTVLHTVFHTVFHTVQFFLTKLQKLEDALRDTGETWLTRLTGPTVLRHDLAEIKSGKNWPDK